MNLALRTGEVGMLRTLVDTTNVVDHKCVPPNVDEDWHANCRRTCIASFWVSKFPKISERRRWRSQDADTWFRGRFSGRGRGGRGGKLTREEVRPHCERDVMMKKKNSRWFRSRGYKNKEEAWMGKRVEVTVDIVLKAREKMIKLRANELG